MDAFKCRKCGVSGGKYFSWDGECLACEDVVTQDSFSEMSDDERDEIEMRDLRQQQERGVQK